MAGDILTGVEKIVCRQLDDRIVNGVLSETRLRALIEGVFDERVTPFVNAMAANREGGGTTAREKPPGAVKESEDGFFFSIITEGCAEFLWIGLLHIAP